MAAANAADPKTERKTEAERPCRSAEWGRVGPSRAEWGRLGLSGVGVGMHWDSIKLL